MHLQSNFILLICMLGSLAAAETPVARIAVLSNPYVTTLPSDRIIDESGRNRGFLAKSAPQGIGQAVDLVNRLKPDAVVVLGSLTWSGSEGDFAAVAGHLSKIRPQWMTVAGHRDIESDGNDRYLRFFRKQNVSNSIQIINGVRLVFAHDLHVDPTAATRRIRSQLTDLGEQDASVAATMVFASRDRTMGRSKLTERSTSFWKLLEDESVSVRIEPTRYGHKVGLEESLPTWTVSSTGWSGRGAVTLITVYRDRIELAETASADQVPFSLNVPNTSNGPGLTKADVDKYRCPSYSLDLAEKPDFTFALVSDPQFDREANREYLIAKARAAIEELNLLNPAKVFVAGDLVNNNLPEEWELFNREFGELKPELHVVPGNHDVLFNYDFVEESYSSAPRKKPEYAKVVAEALKGADAEGFRGATALYEKFTGRQPRSLIKHKNCAFITVPFLTTRADVEQLEFLQESLNASKEQRHVFVVAHYPSLPAFGNNLQPTLGGDQVLSWLNEYRVTGYLFGHRHRNGFQMHERTAHVLTDNMMSIHLFHVFNDRIVIGRKQVGAPLYERLVIPAAR